MKEKTKYLYNADYDDTQGDRGDRERITSQVIYKRNSFGHSPSTKTNKLPL